MYCITGITINQMMSISIMKIDHPMKRLRNVEDEFQRLLNGNINLQFQNERPRFLRI